MKTVKKLIIIVTLMLLTSCTRIVDSEYNFTDDLGRAVSLDAESRVAACHASFADCWLLAGGELVAVTSDAVEEHGLDVGGADIVGTAKTVDLELLLASGADTVLLSADLASHLALESQLEPMGIECIYFKVDTFDDYAKVMKRMCDVTGREDLYLKNVTAVGEGIERILSSIPQGEKRTVLLMRAYSSGIKAKSDDNLAGLILKEYGLRNLADESPSLLEDMSLEHIVAADPDVIFVLTMGNEESAENYLKKNIESNSAFRSLKAVKNGSYYILPKKLFHYKPNDNWRESYEYLAKLLYPSSFE